MSDYMKRCIICTIISTLILLAAMLAGCNYNLIDTTYRFDKAIIKLPDGSIVQGKVTNWTDYEGDQLQVKIGNTTYLTHAENVVLINSEGEQND